MRLAARRLVTLRSWAGMTSSSADAAQLAMFRLLWLQRETHRAVRGRHREAAAMLARASVEGLLLGIYCLRVPDAIAKLHADNLKALGDGLSYIEETDLAPAQVIRECVARLGTPSGSYLSVWSMVTAIDAANENNAARSVYRRLYAPLSNYTVHANGGTLLRHVGRDGKLRRRPSRAWGRRSPARAVDAATGLLAADLAKQAGQPYTKLLAYGDRHYRRTIMPMAVMAFTGMGGSSQPRRLREAIRLGRQVYIYLWTGPASADSVETRTAFVRERFVRMLGFEGDPDIPADSLDPFIDYLADKLAHAVPPKADDHT
ncbi:MAG: hypothetical protein JO345_33240 [Streptosporangiaceae bacterium]|nr:hypothetical protein [Streptosporangiaceae bacterium]